MDHPAHDSAGLNATTSRDALTGTVRIDILGSLNQASRPALIHMIQTLRSTGIQSHISVDISHAARVESTALAGLRRDLNAMEGASRTPGGVVTLMLTGVGAEQPAGSTVVPLRDITEGIEAEAAAPFETGAGDAGPSTVPLAFRALEDYSDDELYAASDEVFSLLDHPAAVGGPDLLGRYNDIGEEIQRRASANMLLNPAAERQAAS
jgi:hypothetical protein